MGKQGEDIAVAFLRRNGASIVERNLKVGRGELDVIIATPRRVAVEVKSGSSSFDPLSHFDEAKQQQVQALARATSCRRVDVVTVWFQPDGVWVRWLKGV